MEIELDNEILEFCFQYCQIELTGRCNMRCEHCRAWQDAKVDIPFELYKKAIDFVVSEADDKFRMVLSGGEPFLHKDLVEMVKYAKKRGISHVIITTNGSLVSLDKLKMLKEIGMEHLGIQISIDSPNPAEHDKFRNSENAFSRAVEAFNMARSAGLPSSLRATITPDRINKMEDLVKIAASMGAIRVAFGSVIPAGRGKINKNLVMNKSTKKRFIEKIAELNRKYSGTIDITTEDPLKFTIENCPWDYGKFDIEDCNFFGGCTAGVSGINITSEGIITPCSVLLKEIVDLRKHDIETAKKVYVNSEIIKSLFRRKFKGRCAICKLKRLCGGCRAFAEGLTGDYLGEDPSCFKD